MIRLRYHVPFIGGWLYRRDMRRLGRLMAEGFRQGMDQAERGLLAVLREQEKRADGR